MNGESMCSEILAVVVTAVPPPLKGWSSRAVPGREATFVLAGMRGVVGASIV